MLLQLSHIAALSSRVATLPSIRSDLEKSLDLTQPPFSHVSRMTSMAPSYITALAELYRRDQCREWLLCRVGMIQEVMADLCLVEKQLRSDVNASISLPFSIDALANKVFSVEVQLEISPAANITHDMLKDALAEADDEDLKKSVQLLLTNLNDLDDRWRSSLNSLRKSYTTRLEPIAHVLLGTLPPTFECQSGYEACFVLIHCF